MLTRDARIIVDNGDVNNLTFKDKAVVISVINKILENKEFIRKRYSGIPEFQNRHMS